MISIKLQITPWHLAVCKLTENKIPTWAEASPFLNFTKTVSEFSLVCSAKDIPQNIQAEMDWRCLKIDGILDFSLIGVIAHLTQILASKQISVFVISTYDTDYILIKQEKFEEAIHLLKIEGYTFTEY
ncbi:MAG: ACT domain-containing protein [Alphaproteobacteria bacterium]|nr:ACT domain-containing protein [Alphaproteobacteria bacterium]